MLKGLHTCIKKWKQEETFCQINWMPNLRPLQQIRRKIDFSDVFGRLKEDKIIVQTQILKPKGSNCLSLSFQMMKQTNKKSGQSQWLFNNIIMFNNCFFGNDQCVYKHVFILLFRYIKNICSSLWLKLKGIHYYKPNNSLFWVLFIDWTVCSIFNCITNLISPSENH